MSYLKTQPLRVAADSTQDCPLGHLRISESSLGHVVLMQHGDILAISTKQARDLAAKLIEAATLIEHDVRGARS